MHPYPLCQSLHIILAIFLNNPFIVDYIKGRSLEIAMMLKTLSPKPEELYPFEKCKREQLTNKCCTWLEMDTGSEMLTVTQTEFAYDLAQVTLQAGKHKSSYLSHLAQVPYFGILVMDKVEERHPRCSNPGCPRSSHEGAED